MALEIKEINKSNWTGESDVIHIDKESKRLIIPSLEMSFKFRTIDEDTHGFEIEVRDEEESEDGPPAFYGYFHNWDSTFVFRYMDISREGKDIYETAAQLIFNLY
jgi:hypothetical protein